MGANHPCRVLLQRAPRSHSAGHSSSLGPPGGRRFGAPHPDDDELLGLEEEDDIVAADLDMHSLILTSNPQDHAVSFSSLNTLRVWNLDVRKQDLPEIWTNGHPDFSTI